MVLDSRSRLSDALSASSSAAICLRSAAICWLSSSTCDQRALADLLLVVEVVRQRADCARWRRRPAPAPLASSCCETRSSRFPPPRARPADWPAESSSPALPPAPAPEVGQFVDLRVEPVQHLVLAGDLAAQQELRQHEHRQQEHDGEQQRRQRVDETRPVVDRALVAAAAGERHQCISRCLQGVGDAVRACCASPSAPRTAPRPSRA